jgi:hypothetical protein
MPSGNLAQVTKGMKRANWNSKMITLKALVVGTPGANPTTFECTATTPALKYIDYSVFQRTIKIFLFSKRARLPVAL